MSPAPSISLSLPPHIPPGDGGGLCLTRFTFKTHYCNQCQQLRVPWTQPAAEGEEQKQSTNHQSLWLCSSFGPHCQIGKLFQLLTSIWSWAEHSKLISFYCSSCFLHAELAERLNSFDRLLEEYLHLVPVPTKKKKKRGNRQQQRRASCGCHMTTANKVKAPQNSINEMPSGYAAAMRDGWREELALRSDALSFPFPAMALWHSRA